MKEWPELALTELSLWLCRPVGQEECNGFQYNSPPSSMDGAKVAKKNGQRNFDQVLEKAMESGDITQLDTWMMYSLPEKEGCGGFYQVVSDEGHLVARYGYRMTSKDAKKSRVPWFEIARVGDEHAPDPMELWTVDHLVEVVPGVTRVKLVIYQFDFERANRESKQASSRRAPRAGPLLRSSTSRNC
jgi:hypothetical protein